MTYDRANRVAQLDESPAAGTAVRTCIDYDGAGNVLRVSPGCSGSANCAVNDAGVTSTCTQAPNDYTHDDFGNVVGVTLANTEAPGGGRGETRFEFDAQGALVKKQTESLRGASAWVEYTVDKLGRTTAATHWTGSTPTELYSLVYDSASVPSGCTATARTKGRLAASMDPVWQTYFSYNAQGQVLAEVRLRRNLSACAGPDADDSPATVYTYSANGNVYTIKYPHGRTVLFQADSNNPDRATAVWTKRWYGAWYGWYPLLGSVVWEPYGGLRAYKVVNQGTWGALASVEYLGRGPASTPPATNCPAVGDAIANPDGTGRLRALWVTAGSAALESGAGDILKRIYTWQGDEVVRIDTCYLGQTTSQQEALSYDRTLRLTTLNRPNWYSTGGPQAADSYTFSSVHGADVGRKASYRASNRCEKCTVRLFDGGFVRYAPQKQCAAPTSSHGASQAGAAFVSGGGA